MLFDQSLKSISEGPNGHSVNDRIGRGRQGSEAKNCRLNVEIKFEMFFVDHFKFCPNDYHGEGKPKNEKTENDVSGPFRHF